MENRNRRNPKTTVKDIVRNGRATSFHVYEEPQADLYAVPISSLGIALFTKKEIDIALTRAVKLRQKYQGMTLL